MCTSTRVMSIFIALIYSSASSSSSPAAAESSLEAYSDDVSVLEKGMNSINGWDRFCDAHFVFSHIFFISNLFVLL